MTQTEHHYMLKKECNLLVKGSVLFEAPASESTLATNDFLWFDGQEICKEKRKRLLLLLSTPPVASTTSFRQTA